MIAPGGRRRGDGRAGRDGGRRLGAGARRGRRAAGASPHERLAPGSTRSRRGAPAQPRQAHLPRAHRPAARRRLFREVGSLAGLRLLRRGRRRRRLHAGQPRRRLGHASTAAPRSSAPTTSPRAAATPTARSAPRARYLDRLSIELRVPSIRLLDGSSGGGSVAAMVPEQQKDGRERGQGEHRRHQGRPAARGGRRRLVPARPPRQHATTPSSWPRCRSSTCCSAASSASARPRPCSATSR